MKGIRYAGLLTAAVSALVMATGASGAFGSEFKTASFPVEVKGHGGAATFVSENGNTVTCEKSESEGKLTTKTEGEVKVKYSGKCELKAVSPFEINEPCEPVTTEELKVQPGSKLNGGSETGLVLTPKSGTVMANISCGSVSIEVTGGVICKSEPIGKLSLAGTVSCKEAGAIGAQEFTSAEVEKAVVTHSLTANSEAFGGLFKSSEKDAQNTTETLEFGKEVEQTA